MASKISIANRIGWGLIAGGIFLAGYHGCRNQSVVYERDIFGRVTSAKLVQFGRESKLVQDPQNSDRLVVEGNPTLNNICDSIGSGARWIYNEAQDLRNQSNISSKQNSQQDNMQEVPKINSFQYNREHNIH